MIIERDADDVARCFALERVLHERGLEQPFAGEITGLISAGAFIAFDERGDVMRRFEGMLPVRLLRAPAAGGERSREAEKRGRSSTRSSPARRPVTRERSSAREREWWELNEQGTILQGERTGATLRLGDPLEVRVARVDSIRGRVDLEPPPSAVTGNAAAEPATTGRGQGAAAQLKR